MEELNTFEKTLPDKLDFENINLKMEKLQVENKWKLIIYENIKTSYIKDYYLDTEETLYGDILLEKLKIDMVAPG